MFQIKGRPSFQYFLGLGRCDAVSDANTTWNLPQAPAKAKVIKELFRRFDVALKDAGYLTIPGQIIDASTVAVPQPKTDRR